MAVKGLIVVICMVLYLTDKGEHTSLYKIFKDTSNPYIHSVWEREREYVYLCVWWNEHALVFVSILSSYEMGHRK